MAYRGAIFDLDGTLLDSMGIWANLCSDFLREHGIREHSSEVEKKLVVLSLHNAVRYMIETYHLDDDPEEACARIWKHVEDFYRDQAELKPGVSAILDALSRAGIPAGIITATEPELVAIALRRVGLADYFAGGVMSCVTLQTSKRQPEVFLAMASRLGVVPGQTVVFEDAFYAGRTAKNAGFALAAVADPYEKRQAELAEVADWYCPTWADFPLEVLQRGMKDPVEKK